MEPREVEDLGSPFDPDCHVLLQQLDLIVRQLPGGYGLKPFGSFVSGTAVEPAVLDLAIFQERPSAPEAPGLSIDPVEALCQLLRDRPRRFKVMDATRASSRGQRIMASGFGGGRQELILFQGDVMTGIMDLVLLYVLPLHPQATAMIKAVKRWALRRLPPSGGGCFGWTMLCVFFFQQQGFLPPLHTFQSGEAPNLNADSRELREAIFDFADFAVSYLSRPHPRPSLNLWFGRLDATEASVVTPWTNPNDSVVLEELRRLRNTAADRLRPLHQLGDQPGGEAKKRNFLQRFPAHDTAGRTISTPPPVARRSGASSAAGAEPSASSRPEREAKPSGSAASHRASSVTPAADPVPTAAPKSPGPSARPRWHIDDQWLASKICQGRVVLRVQLSAEEQGSLTREGWAQRFERREWQIHLGKITREYQRWANYFLRRGRSEGDPVTPRAIAQTPKANFEAEYTSWRVKLHSNPPA